MQTSRRRLGSLPLLFVAWLMLYSSVALAAEPEKFFYVGEVKLSSGDGKPTGSQVILFEKTHDQENSRMVEAALVVHPDGKVEEHFMRLTVTGDTFTIKDDANTIEGSGTLSGPAWHWTYFKAKYKSKNGIVEIEDENFMSDDSVITARKKISGPDGKVFMYMDMSLKSVTAKTFEILRAGLLKK